MNTEEGPMESQQIWMLAAVALFSLSCGTGPGDLDVSGGAPVDASRAESDAPPAVDATPGDRDPGSAPIDARFDGGFVKKALALPGQAGFAALLEVPLSLHVDFGRPRRELRLLRSDGTLLTSLASGKNDELLDVTSHPEGDLTLVYASNEGYRLRRLDPHGKILGQTLLADPDIATDPPLPAPGSPTGPIHWYTHDTARVATAGDDVVLATRTLRGSVVVYRLRYQNAAFTRVWRVLALPAIYISPIALTGGTYDTFGQLEAFFAVHLSVADDGSTYVGFQHPGLGAEQIPEVLSQVFGETIAGDPDAADVYVVRISDAGARLGTSVVSSPKPDELYGLRAFDHSAYVVGRNETWNAAGTGFDALVARVDGKTGASQIHEIDVSGSDIAFDVAPAAAGGFVVVGASAYTQNPYSASISEHSVAFARWFGADGKSSALAVPNGLRHNEARAVVPLGSQRFLAGGMLDGPGTHSADSDPSLLSARGYVVELDLASLQLR